MTSKIQGEGDYESAREYNRETKEFVTRQQKEGKEIKGTAAEASATLTPSEKEALQHAKHGEQDKRDAEVFRRKESHSPK